MFDALNQYATTKVATMVGTTITSMIASAFYRIMVSAAPTGPLGASTTELQPARSTAPSTISAQQGEGATG